MKSIAVFCGSSLGAKKIYEEAAYATGQTLVREGLRLIYGGGKVGLMGVLADSVLSTGGEVVGVIPRALFNTEVGHRGLTHLRVVESMHERKKLMADLADAFIALPGGAGTLEEIFEQWTWSQLGIHRKPCGILNVNNYFSPVRAMVEHAVAEGFTKPTFAAMLAIEDDLESLLAHFRNYRPGCAEMVSAGAAYPAMTHTSARRATDSTPIRIAAAIIVDQTGSTLLVRKRGTLFFMQPGGKIEKDETPASALAREIREELGYSIVGSQFVGAFSAPAANEPPRQVEATIFQIEVEGSLRLGAEIEEAIWIDPRRPGDVRLAPLTRDCILPAIADRLASS